MAIFNREYLAEVLSKTSDYDNKEAQYKKTAAIIQKLLESESFAKEFIAVPKMYSYDDDDSAYAFGDWIRGKTKYLSICWFPKDKYDPQDIEDSANFIIKNFEKMKKEDSSIQGRLKFQNKFGFNIDYVV